jgi:hypothetical protein
MAKEAATDLGATDRARPRMEREKTGTTSRMRPWLSRKRKGSSTAFGSESALTEATRAVRTSGTPATVSSLHLTTSKPGANCCLGEEWVLAEKEAMRADRAEAAGRDFADDVARDFLEEAWA